MMYIIDTFAWVEYFIGSEMGKKVQTMINSNKNQFVTMECCLAELKGWCIRNTIDFQEIASIVEANSKVIPVSKTIWINAAEIKSEMMKTRKDFGLIDALLLAKQKELKCRIITADKHFKNLKGIAFLTQQRYI